MRVFISHAWEDKPLALALARLPDFVQAWVDIRELLGGQRLDPTIVLAIEESHVFVVLLSRVSIGKAWVAKEVEWALDREMQKDRVFVLPVVVDAEVVLADSPAPFGPLAERLFITATDHSEAGLADARARIADTLFHWASDWLERLEPKGDSHRRFVEQMEQQWVEYQTRLHAVKAALAWPLPTLVLDEAVLHLIEVKDRYNAFTETFIPWLVHCDDEVRWRFGLSAQRAFGQLATFVRNEVFHGAAFALNDVIESINAYDTVLKHDPAALAQAEARRAARVAALEPVLAQLVRRTAEYISTLKP